MAELTPSQRRILDWLYSYPGVQLNAAPGMHIIWTAMWASEAARQDLMRAIPELLGGDPDFVRPRGPILSGPTPRCGWSTFLALQRAGFLRPTGRNRGELPRYFQISATGIAALLADLRLGVPRQPMWGRPMRSCGCGWQGRSVGGHQHSRRHLEWLALQRYRRETLEHNAAMQNVNPAAQREPLTNILAERVKG